MNAPDSSARFITFEGIEGCGKSTQLARLASRLRALGLTPLVTREPGGTGLGQRLRPILLGQTTEPIAPTAELLLYVADRVQHLLEVVEPALEAGRIVLCDRYLDATVAYQGHARGLGVERILALHGEPPLDRRPDRTILLDLEVEAALERARARNAQRGLSLQEGRFEGETLAFHRRVREGYLAEARRQEDRFRTVDASGDLDTVGQRIDEALADLLPVGLETR
jgi:dTMP kinase